MSRFVKMPLRRNGRPGIIRYVASRASWIVASIVLASGLMAESPAQANVFEIDVTSFEFTNSKVHVECCVAAGATTGEPMFFVENEVTATAVFDDVMFIELTVGVSFMDNGGPSPTLAGDYQIRLNNTGEQDLPGYSLFAGFFGPAVFAYALAPEPLVGTYTATVLAACAYFGNEGCVDVRFTPADVSGSFRGALPEPSTLALFAIALAGLGFFMTRRRRVA